MFSELHGHLEKKYTVPLFCKSHRCLSADDELGQYFRESLLTKSILEGGCKHWANYLKEFMVRKKRKSFASGVIWGGKKQDSWLVHYFSWDLLIVLSVQQL